MKGLLQKEYYMILAYGRVAFISIIVFSLLNIFTVEAMFIFYPAILSTTIIIILLSYDEYSKWNIYSNTLPITRAQQVHSKYIVGLLTTFIIIITSGISLYIRYRYMPFNFTINNLLYSILMVTVLSIITSAIQLPFLYQYGVNKGKIAFYIFFAIIMSLTNLISTNNIRYELYLLNPAFLLLASAVIYGISWNISIIIYSKKEF